MTNTTAHPDALQVRTAAELAASAVAAVPADRWTAPTPCRDHDLRTLVDHLAWAAVLSRHAAAREPLEHDWSTPAPSPFLAGLPETGWAAPLALELRRAAEAWTAPEAWEGETVMGTTPMPAGVVGPMMLAGFALHGRDVAPAAGPLFRVPTRGAGAGPA